MAVVNWLNSRVKANVILGNVGSAMSQLANMPSGIAYAKQYSFPGMVKTFKTLLTDEAVNQSGFLKERMSSRLYRQFDKRLIDKPKNLAIWLVETADRVGTEFIWNSVHSKGLAEGVANPVKYADDVTRSLVAGRGIGEVPIIQKSRVFQVMAPFQLEVANLWHVQKDFLKAKDFGGLITLYLSLYMFNKAMEETRGTGVVFDPIDALQQALTEEDLTPVQRGGRLLGEVLSNVPLGQTIAAVAPEYGGQFMGMEVPTRKELFGESDPTRFGTGLFGVLAGGVQDPLYKIFLPFGGLQASKTVRGLEAIEKGGVYNKDGTEMKYPVEGDILNQLLGTAFGPSGFRETREYYEENRRPLSEKQTKRLEKAKGQGKDVQPLYQAQQKEREINAVEQQIRDLRADRKLAKEEKQKKIKELLAKRRKLAEERKALMQKE